MDKNVVIHLKMIKLLQAEFGFQNIEIKKLDGYDNANYLIEIENNKYIFKTYIFNEEIMDLVMAENEILLFIQKSGKKKYPKPIPFTNGSYLKTINIEGEKRVCRILSFLDGEFLGNVEHTETLFHSFGVFLAEIDLNLQKFKNHTIMARQWEWDIQFVDLNKNIIQSWITPFTLKN